MDMIFSYFSKRLIAVLQNVTERLLENIHGLYIFRKNPINLS